MGNDAPRRLLIINASPHRAASTTLLATNAFVAGMQAGGAYDCETVHLCALKITPCTGCLSCWGRTEGECVIRDDDIPRSSRRSWMRMSSYAVSRCTISECRGR